MPVKNLSPSPVLYGANVNPHQSPQEFYTCESKFKQEKKKKGGLRFLLREFYWNIPFMSLHTEERLDWVTAAFTPTHLLPYCYSYLFSGDLRNNPPEIKPFTFRSTMTKIKKPSAFLHHDMNYALQQFKNCFSNLNAAASPLGFQRRHAAGPVPSLSV